MRATKGYVAGVGTTTALMGAIGCAFAVLSAVVAVHGWPLTLSTPGMTTVDRRAPVDPAAFSPLRDVFAGRADGFALERGPGRRSPVGRLDNGQAPTAGGPFASAFGPAGGRLPMTSGTAHAPAAGPGASAASPTPVGGGGTAPRQPAAGGASSGTAGSPTTPTGPSSGGSTTLGGTVTQVTSSTGTAVAQTGQQLSGAVQGATGQLGGTVGQVNPVVGQAVTQTGQVVGGVVSGATGTAGQVVAGAGTTVGGVLGGLTGGAMTR